MTLRSRPVIWRIGSTPSSTSSAEQATGESLTVAAWLSVTLTASTEPARARAPARTSSGSGSRGGPSSAVTTKLRDDSAEASIARLGGEFVVVVVADRASVGIAVAGAQDGAVRAFAVGEGLDGDREAAALADQLEDGGVDPVDDRALELARSTIRRVVADIGGEQVLGDEDALVMQELEGLREALGGHGRHVHARPLRQLVDQLVEVDVGAGRHAQRRRG